MIATPEAIEKHKIEMSLALGANWREKAFRCSHCGNGTVKYIAACIHIPTGEKVVFGSQCVERLNFKDGKQFQLARLKSLAEAHRTKLANYLRREEFIKNNPGLNEIVEKAKEITYGESYFIRNIADKLDNYGYLSDKQVDSFVKAVNRHFEYKEKLKNKPKGGPAPVGKQTITGTIVSFKDVESNYGYRPVMQTKMLVLLENGSKVYGTMPASVNQDTAKGSEITFTATFEVSKNDESFGFFKRPSKVTVKELTTAQIIDSFLPEN